MIGQHDFGAERASIQRPQPFVFESHPPPLAG